MDGILVDSSPIKLQSDRIDQRNGEPNGGDMERGDVATRSRQV